MSATADFVARVNNALINPLLALIFVAALLYFMWGLFVFISQAGEDAKRTEGKQHMLWGVIGMVIMVSVFAILQIGLRTFGVTNQNLPTELPLKL